MERYRKIRRNISKQYIAGSENFVESVRRERMH
jgi:hypothetical protein